MKTGVTPRFIAIRLLALGAIVFGSSLSAGAAGGATQAPLPQPVAASAETPAPDHALAPAEVAERLGILRPSGMTPTEASLQVARYVEENGLVKPSVGGFDPSLVETGLPKILSDRAAASAQLMTAMSGRGQPFAEVALLADFDGREDLTADHSAEVVDLSGTFASVFNQWQITRVAFSEHTLSSGFTETVYYYGDSLGNVFVSIDTDDNDYDSPLEDSVFAINLPTVLNAFGYLLSDDQIVVTGLAVNPVADLSSFARVNGSYAGFDGQIGEILYVTFWDTGGGLRMAGNNTLVRSGLLAFPVADLVSPAPAPPGTLAPAGFPVRVGGAFGVAYSVFDNLAGVAVDDDGSVYFQQVDLTQFSGANLVKATSVDAPGAGGNQDRSLATSGIITLSSLNPAQGIYGTTSGPLNQVNRFTNFSGTSSAFGNLVALASGAGNTVYAAAARSYSTADSQEVQDRSGLFPSPAALGPTPSMIISFADNIGAFEICSSITQTTTGTIPIADGFADTALAGQAGTPGVNNFRAFVLGNGPDLRGTLSDTTTSNTLQLDLQIDYTIYSGLAVDEQHQVYVISGGTPAGVGRDPSPALGEILVFPDQAPRDRRGDFVDLRGDLPPNGATSGAATADGDSDRFDHIFWSAPLDQVSVTPSGVAGLSRGFLVYVNRTRTDPAALPNLPNGATQGDNATSGPVTFESFDPSHQAAGGDDQNPPFRGDDAGAEGSPPMPGLWEGGFEFVLGDTAVYSDSVWNGFYLNSNGNLTFGTGDTDNTPSANSFVTGAAKIAPAWMDLNPASRIAGYTNTFPVQALGFAGINQFVARWINVPEAGREACGSRNTLTVTLYDDGTGLDESASSVGTAEGPTDLRFQAEPATGALVGLPARPQGSGQMCFDYGRMDAIGLAASPILAGFAAGSQPPGAGEINLSEVGRAADLNAFPNPPGLIGDGSQYVTYEFFDSATPASGSSPAVSAFDLRFEGNDPASGTPAGQPNRNRDRLCFFGAAPRAPSITNLFSSPNPSQSGGIVAFTATVTSTLGVPLPSGLVLLKEGAATVGVGIGPIAPIPIATLAFGSHSLTAHYLGDGRFEPSVSPVLIQVVNLAPVVFLPAVSK
ncbi:MAG: Ig-like domain repeat protein [Anaerolineales bacterium]|nr:Ig-like domain repeat protein [Anaerolineales bacterium]